MGMKLVHRGQKGVTLVELVIVVALAGIVSIAITASLFQMFSFSTLASNQMTAIRQVQQAGFWVSPDVMMAQVIDRGESSGFPLTLTWTDPESSDAHEVTYRLEDMGNGLDRLVREHRIIPATGPETIITMVVAEYVDAAATGFSPAGDGFELTVAATLGEQDETRTYEVQPRVGT
jgi:prepilin-type N-terminal cleavage/methylation domain-containing protein